MDGWRYNPPPNWPQPPLGWDPPPGWQPPRHWPPAPPDWPVWVRPGEPPQPARVPVTPEAAPAGRRLKSLVFGVGTPIPAVITFLWMVVFKESPPLVYGFEATIGVLLGVFVPCYFVFMFFISKRLRLFTDVAGFFVGVVRGRTPHLIAAFLLAQGVLFVLAVYGAVQLTS
jgi:hypothetical protein